MTWEALEPIVEDWAEMLYGIIPTIYLEPSYLAAYREHKPGFPMECAELLQAWYKTQASTAPTQTYAQSCVMCQAHNDNLELPPCVFHQDKMLGLPYVTMIDDLALPRFHQRCTASKTVSPGVTFRCRLWAGHTGGHEAKADNNQTVEENKS